MCNVLILHKNDSILDTYGSLHRSVCACVVDDPNRTRLRPVAFDHLRLGGSLNDRKVVARLGFLNVAHRTLLAAAGLIQQTPIELMTDEQNDNVSKSTEAGQLRQAVVVQSDCPLCEGKGWYFVDEWIGPLQGRRDCACGRAVC